MGGPRLGKGQPCGLPGLVAKCTGPAGVARSSSGCHGRLLCRGPGHSSWGTHLQQLAYPAGASRAPWGPALPCNHKPHWEHYRVPHPTWERPMGRPASSISATSSRAASEDAHRQQRHRATLGPAGPIAGPAHPPLLQALGCYVLHLTALQQTGSGVFTAQSLGGARAVGSRAPRWSWRRHAQPVWQHQHAVSSNGSSCDCRSKRACSALLAATAAAQHAATAAGPGIAGHERVIHKSQHVP